MAGLSEATRTKNRVIGERIASQRKTLGMTQRELAIKLNLPYYNFIGQLETGMATVPANLWRKLATVLMMDPIDFCLECLKVTQPDTYEALWGDLPVQVVVTRMRRTK